MSLLEIMAFHQVIYEQFSLDGVVGICWDEEQELFAFNCLYQFNTLFAA